MENNKPSGNNPLFILVSAVARLLHPGSSTNKKNNNNRAVLKRKKSKDKRKTGGDEHDGTGGRGWCYRSRNDQRAKTANRRIAV